MIVRSETLRLVVFDQSHKILCNATKSILTHQHSHPSKSNDKNTNKLTKLRRHASRVHFAKNTLENYTLEKYTLAQKSLVMVTTSLVMVSTSLVMIPKLVEPLNTPIGEKEWLLWDWDDFIKKKSFFRMAFRKSSFTVQIGTNECVTVCFSAIECRAE